MSGFESLESVGVVVLLAVFCSDQFREIEFDSDSDFGFRVGKFLFDLFSDCFKI
jgi:hypothetical protein